VYFAAVHFNELFSDVKAESGAFLAACGARASLFVFIEETRDIFRRDADARIGEGNAQMTVNLFGSHCDHAAFVRELNCVGKQIDEDAPQLVAIRFDERQIGRQFFFERDVLSRASGSIVSCNSFIKPRKSVEVRSSRIEPASSFEASSRSLTSSIKLCALRSIIATMFFVRPIIRRACRM
jgi:hypothetical protein